MRRLTLLLTLLLSPFSSAGEATAVFAGGCFWCMESNYQELEGVNDVISGFTGGSLQNPTYKGDHRGHYEAVEISYDPEIISYSELLDLFWVSVDPFDDRGQFCDKGFSYRSAIFPTNAEERQLAEETRTEVSQRFEDRQVYTEILDADKFWPVEEYHQDYYLKNPVRYKYYRWNCGRDQRLEELWGDAANGAAHRAGH